MDLRYRRRLEVHYAARGRASQIGFSGNISNTGMMIRTPNVLAPGTVVDLELRLAHGGTMTLTGRVVWARTGPMTWLATGRIGMGIRFVDPPADLVSRLRSQTAAKAG
jgi:uncharacterized protein (TIGR02266 family)